MTDDERRARLAIAQDLAQRTAESARWAAAVCGTDARGRLASWSGNALRGAARLLAELAPLDPELAARKLEEIRGLIDLHQRTETTP